MTHPSATHPASPLAVPRHAGTLFSPAYDSRQIDDVVVLGAGLAGLFCALRLAPRPVTLLTGAPIGHGASSSWAQGGIAAAVSKGDTVASHMRDTLAAGDGLCEKKIVAMMTGAANSRIRELVEMGVPFDVDSAGRFIASREAAHSCNRVLRVRGDLAGKAIMDALVGAVRASPSIRVIENFIGEELTVEGRFVTGLRARGEGGGPLVIFPARAIVLASGGIGHLYQVTTNPYEARGQGLAMAARAGAMLADCEFVQFHPTAIDVGRDPAPLATEALRGEGATLVNAAGTRFMAGTDRRAELAPRDIVAREIFRQLASGQGAFLDCRRAIGTRMETDFPRVYGECRKAGIDPARDLVPIRPAAHYHMGGVLTDARGRTTIGGLWAIGETAATGAHGANRLASNSLLEAMVFAHNAASDIAHLMPAPRMGRWQDVDDRHGTRARSAPERSRTIDDIRQIMSQKAGVLRCGSGLRAAMAQLHALARTEPDRSTHNMIIAARLITAAAFLRTESRGCHIREDFPHADPARARRNFMPLTRALELCAWASETAARVYGAGGAGRAQTQSGARQPTGT